jgi:uncharacterized protein YndB with AHSA1/START domain
MRWLWIVLAVVVGIPLLMALIGSLLPRDHVARMSRELKSPPERVWALVSDVAGSARWRKDVTDVTVQPAAGGPLRFTEKSKQGTIPFEMVSQEPPRRQVVKIVDDQQPFGGTWTWELTPWGQGTRLTITEAGFIKNPIFRVMSKLFFSPTATMEKYLGDLAGELGE